jgi:hypothetical protein
MEQDYSCVLLGDLNSRCGRQVNGLLEAVNDKKPLYMDPVDNVNRSNENGYKLLQLCKDMDCIIVNNCNKSICKFFDIQKETNMDF